MANKASPEISVSSAAAIIGCSAVNVRRAIRGGSIEARMFGRDYLVSRASAVAYERRNRAKYGAMRKGR